MNPVFERPVVQDGYAWWYLDALSDDGRHGITLIAFIGSVFSPFYARARRDGAGDPFRHCAFNVALYGEGPTRWAFTERGAGSLQRSAEHLRIGPDVLAARGGILTADIDERAAPLPRRIRGRVTLRPLASFDRTFDLHGSGRHGWRPFAPCARVEVELDVPRVHWSGPGYADSNHGDAPLERDFRRWDWSRARLPGGDTAVLYDVTTAAGGDRSFALRFGTDGAVREFAPPPPAALPPTRWRVARGTRAEAPARVVQTLEDTPFYARSVLETRLLGANAVAMHESLSLDRFGSAWVQRLLPFRIRRETRNGGG